MSSKEKLVSLGEAVTQSRDFTGKPVSRRTIARWLQQGHLTKYVDGSGRVYVDPAELRDYVTPRIVMASPHAEQAS